MPFELTKTQQQLASTSERSAPKKGAAPTVGQMGVIKTMRYVVERNGVQGLFYGLPITVIQTSGKVGIRFSAFEHFKSLICAVPRTPTKIEEFVAGCAAGATEAALWITPCERLKVLRQAQIGVKNPLHTSWMSSLLLILRDQGISGLYRGIAVTILRNGLSIGVRFVLYSKIVQDLRARSGSGPKGWEPLVAGASVGAFTTVLNNPLDVIKSRMQADSQDGSRKPRYTSTWHCVKTIMNEEGLLGLWRGLPARILKISLGQGVIFLVYEHARDISSRFL
eukprot:CAMPEP_0184496410 /NCGR_PEP_ID=MMETSP0113_2-20130426/33890_1 /TAXON_ID=91329 /ORGANISM="Norrisiella sphaerica, Strain BC52" /LENGTH=279 /DNA_ID=CAMNT_0026883021 /DNA_START=10 /DNA_END=849 /DNA_ORIENTATION=-